VLKKLFKALTTLTLLVGCYFGYVHVFAIVVEQLRSIRSTDDVLFATHDSRSKLQSIRYARETFGPSHWTAEDDLAYRYYNAERGYWIYARDCERIVEENGVRYDGKRIRMKPFALISKSRDGKNTKTITSDVATFDLNEPLSLNVSSEGEPLKIKHARLEPNVWVNDDKGTPRDRRDDMKIGPIRTVEYDEASQQISTESHVVMVDPDMVTTGDGMLIQLRKDDAQRPGGSSGFQGAERLDLLKNVDVVMRDVGKAGIMPGSQKGKRVAPAKSPRKTEVSDRSGPATARSSELLEPTPLHLHCDSKMQVYLPKPQLPVEVGPPAPPAPTLVQFERNVVVIRGQLDARPDQLTCDTLKLSLVPGEKPPGRQTPVPGPDAGEASAPSAGSSAQIRAGGKPDVEGRTEAATVAERALAFATTSGSEPHTDGSQPQPDSQAGDGGNQGLLGGLTLQRAHATGHAVWLYLLDQGIKLRCNELIHVRQLPFKPDQTYFRGDRTRLLELEKLDFVTEEGPDQGKITSVTNIWTVDATLFDYGNDNGLDSANMVAHGPGRLETRPGRDQPVERVAIWQDKFILFNELGPEGQVVHKIIDLTGERPCFMDKLQKTMIDSGLLIKVTLKPTPALPPQTNESSSSMALPSTTGAGSVNQRHVAVVTAGESPASPEEGGKKERRQQGGSGLGGGNLQIEHLHALRDVHLIAPAKTMTAREWLDAEFVEAGTSKLASASPAQPGDPSSLAEAKSDQAQEQGPSAGEEKEHVTAGSEGEKPSTEPPMVGSCDRMWASLALKPKSESATDKAAGKPAATTKTTSTRRSGETEAEIRKVWMWGDVALHQEPAEGKTKGQDASGEALYLDNRGTNKAITYIYQRDPNEKTYLPGPLPPARVENEDINITAAGVIRMNQATDQAWVDGPGTLTQLTKRGFLTDKDPGASDDEEEAGDQPRQANTSRAGSPGAKVETRTTARVAQNSMPEDSSVPDDQGAVTKPTTRAGRPKSEKVPMTIGFSEDMEFTGRSVDPEGRPAARADFHGIVTAQMEDGLLHCTEKMIAFTDQEVPLAQLGAISRAQSKPAGRAPESAQDNGEEKPKPELTLVYCYKNAIAINRKVDPDAPILIEQWRLEADDILAHDRRSGDFNVRGKGKVYYYNRGDSSSQAPESGVDGKGNDGSDRVQNGGTGPSLTATERTVTPTSGQAPNRVSERTVAQTPTARGAREPKPPVPANKAGTSEIPPLVLTQIHFKKGMIGRFGSGKEEDTLETRWSEFYGDIESMRAKVPDARARLDPDKLPSDGLFLTGQTLRLITEPPPVGSPKSASSRSFMKAWEKAYVSSSDKMLQGDVITYDSYKDLIYSYGENGRGVIYAQQHAFGQPTSPGSARAVQLNPKTGALHLVDSDTIQMIDKNTGIRPGPTKPGDPYAKNKKPPKKPFKLPTMNVERRGFTGQ